MLVTKSVIYTLVAYVGIMAISVWLCDIAKAQPSCSSVQVVEFTASWCSTCQVMKRDVFSD